MSNQVRVKGSYYGVEFTGYIDHKEPNWENGSFDKSSGINILVVFDNEIEYSPSKKKPCKMKATSKFLHGWISGKEYHWGSCTIV